MNNKKMLVELYAENLRYIVQSYGFCAPKNVRITAARFGDHISDVFDMKQQRHRAAFWMLSEFRDHEFIFSYDGTVKVFTK